MKNLILTTAFLIVTAAGLKAQTAWTDKSRIMPDKLRELPVGILMSHDPNPCYPEKIDSIYYWKHHTRATAVYKQLTVVECGSFIWYDSSGWHANMKYSPEEFAKAFNCPGAILKANKTYTYEKNWRFGKQAYGGDALWYIIARDKDGKMYKGYAIIETENKALTSK